MQGASGRRMLFVRLMGVKAMRDEDSDAEDGSDGQRVDLLMLRRLP